MSERRSLRLETERLLLRPPVVDDAPAAVELLADPEVMRFLGGRTVPLENGADVVGTWPERWETHDAGPFVVERRADGRFLGCAGILVWDTRTGGRLPLRPMPDGSYNPSWVGRSCVRRGQARGMRPRRRV